MTVMAGPLCRGVTIIMTTPCAAFAQIVKSMNSICCAGVDAARQSITAHTM